MRNAQITVTMNGETHSGMGKACFTNEKAELSYAFWGETELVFTPAEAFLTRKGEMTFTLPLGKKSPTTVRLKTAYGEIPATVTTTRYSARVGETQAQITVEYLFSDGYQEQAFSFSLSVRETTEET